MEDKNFIWDWLKHEQEIVTSRGNFIIVAQSMLIAAAAALSLKSELFPLLLALVICIAGFGISLLWLFVNLKHIFNTGRKLWEKMSSLDSNWCEIRSGEDWPNWWPRSHHLVGIVLPSIIILLWISWAVILLFSLP